MNNIAEAIRELAKGGKPTTSLICIVDSVDKEARTVDCTPLDESAPILGVNLQANQNSSCGVVFFPRVGSFVVVGFIADGNAGVVLCSDDIESIELVVSNETSRVIIDEEQVSIYVGKETSAELTKDGVVFNGGTLGGLIKVEDLTKKINDLIDAFNNHTHILQSNTVSVVGSPSAQSNPAPITVPAIITKHTNVTRDDFENEKVKQ